MSWRVGSKVPINVYDGDRPVCQCHTVEDAYRIVAAVNAAEPGPLVPWTIEDFADKRPTAFAPAICANPVPSRCLICRKLLGKGEIYRAASTRARTKGRVVHDCCWRDLRYAQTGKRIAK